MRARGQSCVLPGGYFLRYGYSGIFEKRFISCTSGSGMNPSLSAKISLQINMLWSFARQSSVFRAIPDSQLFSECLAPCRSASRSCGYCWYQNSVSRKCQHVPTIFRLRAAKQRRHRRACEPACNLLGVTAGVDGRLFRSFREPRLREARSAPLLALAGAQRKSSRFLSERSTSSSYSTTMSSPGSPSPSGASPLA
jgi:hypothetical protein